MIFDLVYNKLTNAQIIFIMITGCTYTIVATQCIGTFMVLLYSFLLLDIGTRYHYKTNVMLTLPWSQSRTYFVIDLLKHKNIAIVLVNFFKKLLKSVKPSRTNFRDKHPPECIHLHQHSWSHHQHNHWYRCTHNYLEKCHKKNDFG